MLKKKDMLMAVHVDYRQKLVILDLNVQQINGKKLWKE
jgi:hypothetical protein